MWIDLLKIHTEMLQSLSAKMESFDDKTNISEVFLKNANSLKFYTDYVNNFNISMATIKTYVFERKKMVNIKILLKLTYVLVVNKTRILPLLFRLFLFRIIMEYNLL